VRAMTRNELVLRTHFLGEMMRGVRHCRGGRLSRGRAEQMVVARLSHHQVRNGRESLTAASDAPQRDIQCEGQMDDV
jgi:hypothetical protein